MRDMAIPRGQAAGCGQRDSYCVLAHFLLLVVVINSCQASMQNAIKQQYFH